MYDSQDESKEYDIQDESKESDLFDDSPSITGTNHVLGSSEGSIKTPPTMINKNPFDHDSENENFQDDHVTRNEKFRELMEGYKYTFKEKNDCGNSTKKTERRLIDMNKKRKCSYQKTNCQGQHQETIPLNNKVDRQRQKSSFSHHEIDLTDENSNIYSNGSGILDQAQKWGITLRQIRAIMVNIEGRCIQEKWKDENTGNLLTPETVSMYHVKEKIIMPFTEKRKKSFVETLPSTKGPQLPRHCLSYTWRTPFKEIVVMLEQFVKDFSRNHSSITDNQGGGMTDDTPIHISVFAINQYDLNKAGGVLPFSEFSFGMAEILKLVDYRLITHLDQEGKILERVWPIYDIFVTLMESGGAGQWKLYFTHKNKDNVPYDAVGLVPGGAPSDKYSTDTVLREKNFPINLVERFIKYEVKNVQAWSVNDSNSFLNLLTDRNITDLNRDPPTEHTRYTEFQDAFRANFATPGTLQAALSQGDEHWKRMLKVMSKSNAKSNLRFDFESGSGKGWDDLTNFQAKELIRSLPKTTLRLEIFHASYGNSFITELSDWIKTTENLNKLRIENTLINCRIIDGQHKVIKELANSLASIKTLKRLEVWNSNLQETPIFIDMVKTLIKNEEIAKALFVKPFKSLYDADYPDFNKIKSLQAAFINTEQSFSLLPFDVRLKTVNWAQDLNDSDKASLLQSPAGPFLKTILNERFSKKLSLFYIIMNVIVQLVIVALLSKYTGNVETTMGISTTTNFFLVWLYMIEVVQISISTVKEYISEIQNWVDLAQIALLTIINIVPDSDDYLEYAIFVSYFALIFSLGNISFSLATFVDSLIEITKVLFPFLFTAFLIVLGFSQIFRVRYSERECPIDESEFGDASSFISYWACNSRGQSFKTMFYMFLTDGGWYFDDEQSETLMALFAFVIGILLLNIVIAVVSNKFTDVQNNADKVFWVRRLSLIKEVDSLRSFMKKLFYMMGTADSGSLRGTIMLAYRRVKQKKCGIERFSFHFNPSDDDYADQKVFTLSSDDDYVDQKDFDLFFGWWFCTDDWGDTPHLFLRLRILYFYSNWEDIVLPGKVFERILLSCTYKEDLKEDSAVIYFAKASLVTLFAWVMLFIHVLSFLALFIVGFASFGLLWPTCLIKWLFHRGVEEDSTKVDAQIFSINTVVEDLTVKIGAQTSEAKDLSAKVDALGSNAVETKTVVGEMNAKVDSLESNAVEMNAVVGELSTKVDTLTALIGNIEKLLVQQATLAPASS